MITFSTKLIRARPRDNYDEGFYLKNLTLKIGYSLLAAQKFWQNKLSDHE